MSIQKDLTRIKGAKASIKAAIEGKGVTVPDGTLMDGMAALIESIEAGGGGVDLSKTQYSKMTCGTITPSANQSSLTIFHNLGEIPKLIQVFSEEVDDFNSSTTTCLMYFHSYVFTDSNGVVWNNKSSLGKLNKTWTEASAGKNQFKQGDHLTKIDFYNPGGIKKINAESVTISMKNENTMEYIQVLPVTYTWFAIA